MGWTRMVPKRLGAGSLIRKGVTLCGATGQGKRTPSLGLTIRPQHFGMPAPAWLAPGGKVNVLLGTGADHGQVRIVPAPRGDFTLSAYATAKGGTVHLRMEWPAGVSPAKHAAAPLEFDFGEDWLVVTLPGWATPPAPETTPRAAAPAVTSPPARGGYVSVSDRVPDPAAEARLAAKRSGEIRA